MMNYGDRLRCWNEREGKLVMGTYAKGKKYPNLGWKKGMLAPSKMETKVEYWACMGYKAWEGSSPCKNEFFGMVKMGEKCLTREEKGMMGMKKCGKDGDMLDKQWMRGTYQKEFFELKPTKGGKAYENVMVKDGMVKVSMGNGTMAKLALV